MNSRACRANGGCTPSPPPSLTASDQLTGIKITMPLAPGHHRYATDTPPAQVSVPRKAAESTHQNAAPTV